MQGRSNNFGFIVTTARNDFLFAKGLIENIYQKYPTIPICLLVDGNFELDGVENRYNANVIRRKEVSNKFLREQSYGWGLTKMVAFWESPFDTFLLLDADTCIWGNIMSFLDFENFDIIIDKPLKDYRKEDIDEYFFETSLLLKFYPEFNPLGRPYFCTGVIPARKGIFDIDDYKQIMSLSIENPSLFKYGEMGMLNFLIQQYVDREKIRIKLAETQVIVPDYDPSEIEKRFSPKHIQPSSRENVVLHWCGKAKPVVYNKYGFNTELMTHYRMGYLDRKNIDSKKAMKVMTSEDRWRDIRIQSKYYKKRALSLFR
ncbi:MAG: hypothetical protein JXQ96_04805 [Cyclobacteriaceae bacterium]